MGGYIQKYFYRLVYIHVSSVYQLRRPRSNLAPRPWFLISFSNKMNQLSWKIADSQTGVGNIQDILEHFVVAESKKMLNKQQKTNKKSTKCSACNYRLITTTTKKVHQSQTPQKSTLQPKLEQSEQQNKTVLDYNLYKIYIYGPILIEITDWINK